MGGDELAFEAVFPAEDGAGIRIDHLEEQKIRRQEMHAIALVAGGGIHRNQVRVTQAFGHHRVVLLLERFTDRRDPAARLRTDHHAS